MLLEHTVNNCNNWDINGTENPRRPRTYFLR